jgi:hypothetical protein
VTTAKNGWGTLLVCAAVATATDARAVSPPDEGTKTLPCRPTIACTADIVEPGDFEVEAGMLYRRLENGKQWSFPVLAKLTIAKFAQVQLGTNGYTTQFDGPPARFFDAVSLGLKLHVVDQSRFVPSLSISAAAGAPVSRAQEGYVASDGAFFIAYVTKDFGPVHADLNLGLNDLGIDSSARTQQWAALALSVPLPPPFGAMVENYAFTDAQPFSARDAGCLFALSLTARPWLIFDFGGDVGYVPATRAFSSFVGMTIVPVRLWH